MGRILMGPPTAAREQWLNERRSLATASDVAAILGLDPHRDALHVYASKVGAPEAAELSEMVRGRIYEEALGRDYAHQTGRRVDYDGSGELNLRRHAKYHWIGATNDRLTITEDGEQIPLELKLAIGSGWAWKEEVPKHFQVQVLIQTAVFGSTRGAIGGLIGAGPMATADLPFDEELFELIVPRLAEFMERVRDRRPPETQSSLALEPLKRLWPRGDGRTITLPRELLLGHKFKWAGDDPRKNDGIARCGHAENTDGGECCWLTEPEHYGPNDAPTRAQEWESKKAEAKRQEEESKTAEARLRGMMAGAQWGDLGDGSLLERKIGKRSDTLVRSWPRRRR